jgi:hypothetical protein
VWLAGSFSAYGGEPVGGLVKVDDVTFDVDRTFSPVAQNGFDGQVRALASSGTSLFVGGAFTAYRGVADSAHDIAKLDAKTGAIDTAFSPVGATTNGFAPAGASINAILIDGSALYVGLGSSGVKYRNTPVPQGLVKLDTAGGLDATFNVGGGFDSVVSAVAVAGPSVYVGGSFSTYRGGSAAALAKLDKTTGTLDTTFSPPGPGANGVDGPVFALATSGTSSTSPARSPRTGASPTPRSTSRRSISRRALSTPPSAHPAPASTDSRSRRRRPAGRRHTPSP